MTPQKKLKFVIAPDSFKESLSSEQVANAIATGIKQALPNAECVCIPLADGGEGTVKTLCKARNGNWCDVLVHNPLGKKITAHYATLLNEQPNAQSNIQPNQCAVIEMAEASGLALIQPTERNPLLTSTYGVGEMILDALAKGVRKFIIGIGGSATNDGGSGMLTALGAKFYDKENRLLELGAGALARLSHVDLTGLDARLKDSEIIIASDVNNPLLGENGASAVFAPQKFAPQFFSQSSSQKGADKAIIPFLKSNISRQTSENVHSSTLSEFNKDRLLLRDGIIQQLDDILAHYAQILIDAGFADNRLTAGSGGAGGLGFALLGLPNSRIESGIQLVIRESGLAQACQDADYVITGEGRMDEQTLLGKVPMGVLNFVQNVNNKDDFTKKPPVIAICGCLGESHQQLNQAGFTAILPIIPYLAEQEQILANAKDNLIRTARNIASIIGVSDVRMC